MYPLSNFSHNSFEYFISEIFHEFLPECIVVKDIYIYIYMIKTLASAFKILRFLNNKTCFR